LAAQAALHDRPGIQQRYYVEERVLTAPNIGDEVMRDQVHHLLRITSSPTVVVQLVPADAPPRPYLPFTLLEFRNHRTTLYFDHFVTSHFVENTAAIRVYMEVVADLRRMSWDSGLTREWLLDQAGALSGLGPGETGLARFAEPIDNDPP
jgi:hypothetical protein